MWSLLALAGVYDSTPNSQIADKSVELVNLLAYSTTRSRELALAPSWSVMQVK
jgi:hypothetical protein